MRKWQQTNFNSNSAHLIKSTFINAMTKFEYATCLAAALTYLMIMQQDPVGLITFGDKIHASLPARSRRGHLGDVLAKLSNLQPTGATDLPRSLVQVAAMLKTHSLVMLLSDLWPSDDDRSSWQEQIAETISALARLRHGGHDVIVFHILDAAEVEFPYDGPVQFTDAETGQRVSVDATGFRDDYLAALEEFRQAYRDGCHQLQIDYVPLDTSMPFDKALAEYLMQRQSRF